MGCCESHEVNILVAKVKRNKSDFESDLHFAQSLLNNFIDDGTIVQHDVMELVKEHYRQLQAQLLVHKSYLQEAQENEIEQSDPSLILLKDTISVWSEHLFDLRFKIEFPVQAHTLKEKDVIIV